MYEERQITCPCCGGRGWLEPEECEETCPFCNGLGWRLGIRGWEDAGVCSYCSGTGSVEGDDLCSECNGRGFIMEESGNDEEVA